MRGTLLSICRDIHSNKCVYLNGHFGIHVFSVTGVVVFNWMVVRGFAGVLVVEINLCSVYFLILLTTLKRYFDLN